MIDSKYTSAATAASIRVFVIESHVLIAKALRSLLDSTPTMRVVGDSTTLSIPSIQRSSPDVLMIGMDQVDYDLGAAIAAARDACPKLRVCALSGFANPDVMERAMSAGADGFLVKDASINEVEIAVRVVSSGASYADPRIAGRMMQRRFDRSTPVGRLGSLTDRESAILRLIAGGKANKEIGSALDLSEKTIKNYVSRIFVKLDVSARTEAAVFALRLGMV